MKKKKRGSMKQKKSNDSREIGIDLRTAYHEAGHALMDILLNLPFTAVSLRSVETPMQQVTEGQTRSVIANMTEGIIWPDERSEQTNKNMFDGFLNLRNAVSAMAGPVCEAMLVGEIDKQAQLGAQSDFNGIRVCCRAAMLADKPPEQWKPVIMETEIVSAIASQASEILKENWETVTEIANSLMERKYLNFTEVVEIVNKCRG